MTSTHHDMTAEIVSHRTMLGGHILPSQTSKHHSLNPNASYKTLQHYTDRSLLLALALALAHTLQTLHRVLQLIFKDNNMPRLRRAEITHFKPRAST